MCVRGCVFVHCCNLCLTGILVVISLERNACSVFASKSMPWATSVCMSPCAHDQLNAMDADMEKGVAFTWCRYQNTSETENNVHVFMNV